MSCANLEKAVESIKVLIDKNRCGLCDGIDTGRVRYQCGHLQCEDCASKSQHCVLCLTPPILSHNTSADDGPASIRAKDALMLLNSFQDYFQVDVYKRSRLSEQLKLEKEIFPDCIQAPAKYFNKRKSLAHNKENLGPSYFPGEHITSKTNSMDNSLDYVHRWLENNEQNTPQKAMKRKPFAELNVNSPIKRGISKRSDLILEKAVAYNESEIKRKKQPVKSSLSLVNSQSMLDQFWKPTTRGKEFHRIKKDFLPLEDTKLAKKIEKEESGIVIDDEPIVIDDTQSQLVDKDKLAWLAVLEANEKDPYISQSIKTECIKIQDIEKPITKDISRVTNIVPFYKKGYLSNSNTRFCDRPSLATKNHTDIKTEEKTKDVSITIESNSFITTIKMTTLDQPTNLCKKSVPIQTDITSMALKSSTDQIPFINAEKQPFDICLKPVDEKFSDDLFTTEDKNGNGNQQIFPVESTPNKSQVVIADSDSDDGLNDSSIVQVVAEVHEPSKKLQQEILGDLQENEVQERGKRCGRGRTPNSSDSSDKENFDPNKPKRSKFGKKLGKRKRDEKNDFDAIYYLSDEF